MFGLAGFQNIGTLVALVVCNRTRTVLVLMPTLDA